ncbi:MAG: 30S ribosomal protein S7 [Proteobacteria bacterium]|jgi:small subunit ribosomal protein S7|nr:30S ribosomal protein S7 [Pseudomonadota bacterium]
MPRRREVAKREILPDPKFNSTELSKFINIIMERGKKAIAEKIVYNALDIITTKSKKSSIDVFKQAMEAVKPLVELKSRRVGGANYQIPVEVIPSRQVALAMRWIRDAARKRSEKSMDIRLANELLEAIDGRGSAFKRREETHKMAEANKAFAHFRY